MFLKEKQLKENTDQSPPPSGGGRENQRKSTSKAEGFDADLNQLALQDVRFGKKSYN